MRILGVNNLYNKLSFQRKPTEKEAPLLNRDIEDAKKALGIKNLAMIIHGSCCPSLGRDASIGSPYGDGAKKLIETEKLFGFNANQCGPAGKISKTDFSPYISKVFAKNHLFINLEELMTDKYADILTPRTYHLVTDKHDIAGENYGYTNFLEAFENYDIALTECYVNFENKLAQGDEAAIKLNDEFRHFKEKSKEWLIKDGLFKVLANLYGTDDFTKWESRVDRNLISEIQAGSPDAIRRYNLLLKRSEFKIDENSFRQFIAAKQLKEHQLWRRENNFMYITDLLAGFSTADVWSNPDAFLHDYRLGAPFGGVDNGPQAWNIPVLDPQKLFTDNGALGTAGKLLKEKIESSIEYFENIRIDHAIGLVDPYIYQMSSLVQDEKGKVISVNGNNISAMPDIDPDKKYQKILEEIVLPVLNKHNINSKDVVWEDLGCQSSVFTDIYTKKLHLPKITQTEWTRGQDTPRNNWALIGSHDSPPALKMNMKDNSWNVDYLSGFLNADPMHAEEKNNYREKLIFNPLELTKAKFAELLCTAKNIQISFADFFGIDKVYNYGGKSALSNWKLRLNNNWEDTYYKNLESDKPTAINMPEILKIALRGRIDMVVGKTTDTNPQRAAILREKLNATYSPLIERLDHWENVLKEKE